MERRDYLMYQIEMMTQALVSLIRRLLGLKDLTEEVESMTNEVLTEYLAISIPEIIGLSEKDFLNLAEKNKNLNSENGELLAKLLVLNAKSRLLSQEKINLLTKAKGLLKEVDQKSDTYSLEREALLNEIETLLNSF